MRRFKLVVLTKEVSKQPGIKAAVWLLRSTHMKSILMKRSTLQKEKYKMYGSKNKGAPGSETKLHPVFKEINRLREP